MSQVTGTASNLGGSIEYRRYTIDYTDLNTVASTSTTVNLTLLPVGGSQIIGVFAKHSEAFAGGNIDAMTVSVGKAGSATFFTSTFDIFQAVADTTVQETSLFKKGQQTALQVIATFTSSSDDLDALTAGRVDIWIAYFNNTSQSDPPTSVSH